MARLSPFEAELNRRLVFQHMRRQMFEQQRANQPQRAIGPQLGPRDYLDPDKRPWMVDVMAPPGIEQLLALNDANVFATRAEAGRLAPMSSATGEELPDDDAPSVAGNTFMALLSLLGAAPGMPNLAPMLAGAKVFHGSPHKFAPVAETIDDLSKNLNKVQTGEPIQFRYVHNLESSPQMGDRFGQNVEPAGQYVINAGDSHRLPNHEYGIKRFNNPLVIDFGGGYQDATNWKRRISAEYGGLTGKKLSDALRADGYDGIITVERGAKHGDHVSEIVDLGGTAPVPDNPLGAFKLSDETIGTGEGAQAFGHGLYFAENPTTAATYAPDRSYVGRAMAGKNVGTDFGPEWIAQTAVDEHGDEAVSHLRSVLKQRSFSKNPAQMESNKELVEAIRKIEAGDITRKGHLYTADLPDEAIDRMLDWDAPLSEEARALFRSAGVDVPTRENLLDELVAELSAASKSSKMAQWAKDDLAKWAAEIRGKPAKDLSVPTIARIAKQVSQELGPEAVPGITAISNKLRHTDGILKGEVFDPTTGEGAYKFLKNALGGDAAAASEKLKKAGIPGIKFFDGGSRAAGEGTRNFVVFDDKLLKILKRE